MNTVSRSCSMGVSQSRMRRGAIDQSRTSPSRIVGRIVARARRRRERVLAALAFVMLIVAWDATLRLDEQMAPPRMRVSHAVEMPAQP